MGQNTTGPVDPISNSPSLLMEGLADKASPGPVDQPSSGNVPIPSQAVLYEEEIDRKWENAARIEVPPLSDPAAILRFIEEYGESRDLEAEDRSTENFIGPLRTLGEIQKTNQKKVEEAILKSQQESQASIGKLETGNSQTLIEKANQIVESVNRPDLTPASIVEYDITIPDPARLKEFDKLAFTDIPRFAEGTKGKPFDGGLAIVGESGTEIVTTADGKSYRTPEEATLVNLTPGSQVMPATDINDGRPVVTNVDGDIYESTGFLPDKNGKADFSTKYEAVFYGDYLDGKFSNEVERYSERSNSPEEAYRSAEANFLKAVNLSPGVKIPKLTDLEGYDDLASKQASTPGQVLNREANPSKSEAAQKYRVVGAVKMLPESTDYSKVRVDLQLEKETTSGWSYLDLTSTDNNIEKAYAESVELLKKGGLRDYPDAASVKIPALTELEGYSKLEKAKTDSKQIEASNKERSLAETNPSAPSSQVLAQPAPKPASEVIAQVATAPPSSQVLAQPAPKPASEVIAQPAPKPASEALAQPAPKPASEALAQVAPMSASEALAQVATAPPSSQVSAQAGVKPASEALAQVAPMSASEVLAQAGVKPASSELATETTGQALKNPELLTDDEFFKLANLSAKSNTSIEDKKAYEDYEKGLAKKIEVRKKGSPSGVVLAQDSSTQQKTSTITSEKSSEALAQAATATPSSQVSAQAAPKPASEILAQAATATPSSQVSAQAAPKPAPRSASEALAQVATVPPSSQVLAQAAPKPASEALAQAATATPSSQALGQDGSTSKSASAALATKAEVSETARAYLDSEFTADDLASLQEFSANAAKSSEALREFDRKGEFNSLIQDGDEKLAAKKYDEATEKYNQALVMSVDDAKATSKIEASQKAKQEQANLIESINAESQPAKASSSVLAEAGLDKKAEAKISEKAEVKKENLTKPAETLASQSQKSSTSQASSTLEPVSASGVLAKAAKPAEPATSKLAEVTPGNLEKTVTSATEPAQSQSAAELEEINDQYEVEGEARILKNGTASVSLTLIDRENDNTIIRNGSNGLPLEEAYAQAESTMSKHLDMLGLKGLMIPTLDEIAGPGEKSEKPATSSAEASVKGGAVTPAGILSETTQDKKGESGKPEEAGQGSTGFWAKVKSLFKGKEDTVQDNESKSESTPSETLSAAGGENPSSKTDSENSSIEADKEINIGNLMKGSLSSGSPDDKAVSAEEKMNGLSASTQVEQLAKPNEPEDEAKIEKAGIDNMKVKASAPVQSATLNAVANPPNPLIPEVQSLSTTVKESSSQMSGAITQKIAEAASSQSAGSTSSTITNNVSNLTSQPMTQAAQTAQAQPGQSQMQQAAESSGLSEYYLQAIYEALIVQGVKLRTI